MDFLYLLMSIGHRVDVLILPYGHYARRWAAVAIYTWQHSWSAYTSIGVWFSGFSAAEQLDLSAHRHRLPLDRRQAAEQHVIVCERFLQPWPQHVALDLIHVRDEGGVVPW
ncbi:MAG: hypothetical protein JO330_13340 [Mycobacteriaceae bacterium]|nr:hypothetical protein [Mycobacteriaceae bacterium]